MSSDLPAKNSTVKPIEANTEGSKNPSTIGNEEHRLFSLHPH